MSKGSPPSSVALFIKLYILHLSPSENEESWPEVLQAELKMVETCLGKNHKSYGAWHHRCWVMENFPNPPWAAEVKLCDSYLKLDERNCMYLWWEGGSLFFDKQQYCQQAELLCIFMLCVNIFVLCCFMCLIHGATLFLPPASSSKHSLYHSAVSSLIYSSSFVKL